MKRDMDLIRKVLLYIEKQHVGKTLVIQPSSPAAAELDVDQGILIYHIRLLCDAGYLDGSVKSMSRGDLDGIAIVHGIRWQGHEFLDAVRDDTVWREVKRQIEKVPAMTLAAVIPMVVQWVKEKIGLGPG